MKKMSNIKNMQIRKKIEGEVYDILVKTSADLVSTTEGVSLTQALASLVTAIGTAKTEAIQAANDRIDVIVQEAPETFDTLKEIADYIEAHKDVAIALNEAIGGKVDKVEGKGLSTEDFTAELKTKLEGLVNYVHPSTHSASMIDETADRKFMTAAEKTKLEGLQNYNDTEVKADITAVEENVSTLTSTVATKARILNSTAGATENDLIFEEVA